MWWAAFTEKKQRRWGRRQKEGTENRHWTSSAGRPGSIWHSIPGQEDNFQGKMAWDSPVLRPVSWIIGPNEHLSLRSRLNKVGSSRAGSSKIMK